MNINKMREYLGNKYSEEDHISNFLEYWMKTGESREKNDLDCMYLDGDLYADTLFSVWLPLKMALRHYVPKGTKLYKYGKGKKEYECLERVKGYVKNISKEDKLFSKLQKFAGLAETRANVIKLQDNKMQNRGFFYYDQSAPTLYNCYVGGRYSMFFDNNEKCVEEWVKREHLEILYKDNNVSKENIKPIVEGLDVNKMYMLNDAVKIEKMLEQMIDVLNYRKQYYF